jgi:hypothetical protein
MRGICDRFYGKGAHPNSVFHGYFILLTGNISGMDIKFDVFIKIAHFFLSVIAHNFNILHQIALVFLIAVMKFSGHKTETCCCKTGVNWVTN